MTGCMSLGLEKFWTNFQNQIFRNIFTSETKLRFWHSHKIGFISKCNLIFSVSLQRFFSTLVMQEHNFTNFQFEKWTIPGHFFFIFVFINSLTVLAIFGNIPRNTSQLVTYLECRAFRTYQIALLKLFVNRQVSMKVNILMQLQLGSNEIMFITKK